MDEVAIALIFRSNVENHQRLERFAKFWIDQNFAHPVKTMVSKSTGAQTSFKIRTSLKEFAKTASLMSNLFCTIKSNFSVGECIFDVAVFGIDGPVNGFSIDSDTLEKIARSEGRLDITMYLS